METTVNVLKRFLNEMKNYEIKWDDLEQKDFQWTYSVEGNNARRIDIINIQNKYLSKKTLSLEQARRINLSFRTPPEYDQIIVDEKCINSKTS